MLNFVFAILASILAALSGLVFTQYRAFKEETRRLVEIREEYRTYTNAFRKILRENQRLKEGDNESEEASEEDVEKKKKLPS